MRSRSVQYSALVSGHGVAPSVPLPTARPVSERSSTPAPLRSHPREHFAPTLTADGRSASSAPAGVHAGIVRRCPTRATTSSVQPLDALSGTEINGQVDTVSIGEGSPTRLAIVSIPSLTTLRNRMNLEAVALTQESWLSGSNSECSGTPSPFGRCLPPPSSRFAATFCERRQRHRMPPATPNYVLHLRVADERFPSR